VTPGGYTRPMRLALVAAAVTVATVVAGGCATDKKRVEREKAFSAARLDGRFEYDDPLVLMLSPSERQAMANAGMLDVPEDGDLEGAVAAAEAAADDDGDGESDVEAKSGMDKAGDVMMSVLTVSITLGMMAAPYLLF
jgi:hypothetical protein